ncbi:hypothetical protein JCM8547_000319 [Rhodosporidiobolus lusitaniae]
MLRYAPLVALVAGLVDAHMSPYHPSMYGVGEYFSNSDAGDCFAPLGPYWSQDDWWFRGPINRAMSPASRTYPKGVLDVPAGGTITLEIACHVAWTSYGWATTEPGSELDACPGNPGAYHAAYYADSVEEDLLSGCAMAIADVDDIEKTSMENLAIFSVQHECVKQKLTTFEVPAAMPPCKSGKCICGWFWLANTGTTNFYMTAFDCNVSGSTSFAAIAPPQDPVWCGDDPSLCVKGSKRPLYAYNSPTNVPAFTNYNRPGYHESWSFSPGAQNDIFVTSTTNTSSAVSSAASSASSAISSVASSASILPASSSAAGSSAVVSSVPVASHQHAACFEQLFLFLLDGQHDVFGCHLRRLYYDLRRPHNDNYHLRAYFHLRRRLYCHERPDDPFVVLFYRSPGLLVELVHLGIFVRHIDELCSSHDNDYRQDDHHYFQADDYDHHYHDHRHHDVGKGHDASAAAAAAAPAAVAAPLVNLASQATATGSSAFGVSPASAAIDGKIGGLIGGRVGNSGEEWASRGEKAGARLTLTWPSSVSFNQIVLYDRPNTADNILGGSIAFSDNSGFSFTSALPNDGKTPLFLNLSRTVTTTSLKFTVSMVSSTTTNVGLSEIEVYAADASKFPASGISSVTKLAARHVRDFVSSRTEEEAAEETSAGSFGADNATVAVEAEQVAQAAMGAPIDLTADGLFAPSLEDILQDEQEE